jgi:glycosyltransferase involved in cell wall biosynthesis
LKNILAITFWSYKEPLTQSGTLPYLRIISKILPKGSKIFLLTLEKENYKISIDEEKNILNELKEYGIILIRKRYYPFGIMSLISWPFYISHLALICIKNKISCIHAWCTPAGSIGYLLSVITRKPLIIDSYEPHAETMVETGNWKKNSLAFRTLFLFEKLQSRKAYAVIALSSGMMEYAKEKYNTSFIRYYVRATCVDLNLFNLNSLRTKKIISELGIKNNDIVCIYSGKLGGIYLDNEIFELFKSAIAYWGTRFKAILLTDTPRIAISEYLHKYSIDEKTVTSLFVSHFDVKEYLAVANFAICPVKPIPTKKYCSPIKTGEYWAMGLPIIIPDNIGDDSAIIQKNEIGGVLPALNEQEYTIAINKIDELIHSPNIQILRDKIASIAKKHRDISSTEKIYRELYS